MLILQTLVEFYSVTTRKLKGRPDDMLRFLDRLRAVLAVHAADERDFDRATRGERHGLSFWDAMLWATADRIGVRYLLTEDFQDARTLGGVTFVNPFEARERAAPDGDSTIVVSGQPARCCPSDAGRAGAALSRPRS